jgi:hypothetical protein
VSAEIIIRRDGSVLGIYSDAIPYREIAAGLGGQLQIERASHVEPTVDGRWDADLSPCDGPILGPFETRQEALDAEVAWLRRNVLGVTG